MRDAPITKTAREVAERARQATDLRVLDDAVVGCFACPRLVAWREEVAATRRAAFRDQEYWGRPIPGFGAAHARLAILGLAPAAHGGNRTGRIFTGDRSGDVLFAALHRAGLANQPTSVRRDDGLALRDTRIFAAVRCAPPDNKPTPGERDTCAPWLHRELELIKPTLRVVVALGAFAWAAWWPAMAAGYGVRPPSPRPAFGHGARASGEGAPELIGCYHVSQQNTFTGRLTPAMLDEVLAEAKRLAGMG
jgi:uracil-DNA glycosylase